MLQLQEAENWNRPAATTWTAEFLLQEGEMPRFLDQLECGERSQEKASQASNHMLISMREMAVQDRRAYEPRM